MWVAQAAYAGLREELLEALPNALEIRIDPEFSASPHADRPRRRPPRRTPGRAVRRLLRGQRRSTTRGSALFDELHDELTIRERTERDRCVPCGWTSDGFATFRDPTTVDFTDADYFALVGPTGSGKSTVIDAMTFALYGTAPRWGERTRIQYALAPTANRGTVRLVFDVAGQRYVGRPRGAPQRQAGHPAEQPGSNVRRPDRHRRPDADEPTESLAGRLQAVRPQVTELLGLDFDDFCKCVVLPQGEFATFLQASVGERQDILLKLLGAGHYDAIGRMAGQRATEARARIEALAGAAGRLRRRDRGAEAAAAREVKLAALLAAVTAEAAAVTGCRAA